MTTKNKHYDLIIVPGLKLGPSWGLRKDLRARLQAAAKAYQENSGAHIAVCGRWSIGYDWLNVKPPITESKRMKAYLIRHGVEKEDIVMESQSKDTIGNAYYLKRYLHNKPQYINLLVVCAQVHEKRLRFLFNKFFGKSYELSYLPIATSGTDRKSEANEVKLLKEQEILLANVRSGHEEDFKHELYNGRYYTRQAANIQNSAFTVRH